MTDTIDSIDDLWWDGRYRQSFFYNVYMAGDNSNEGHLHFSHLNVQQRTERELKIIKKYFQFPKSGKVLDCPCGYGRHSLMLSQQGFNVTGVDLCPMFLDTAESNASKEGVSEQCRYVQADMRKLPDEMEESFDFCINMFFSFGFFDELGNKQTLEQFYRVLKPGGKLLIHTDVNPDLIDQGKYGDRSIRQLQNGGKLIIKEQHNPTNKRLEGTWTIELKNTERKTAPYSVRIYSHKEMKDLLISCGFSVIKVIPMDDQHLADAQEIAYLVEK